jgi:predicted membrane channel-forming protein YqfA (hemolysin III family)
MSGILSPIHVFILLALHLILFVTALVLILKHEKGYLQLLWIILTLVFPVLGALIYLLRFFVQRNRKRVSVS